MAAGNLFLYWEKVKDEKESVRKEAAAAAVTGEMFARPAVRLGTEPPAANPPGGGGPEKWLKVYGTDSERPRKPGSNWIMRDVARDDPAEARAFFALCASRTGPTSPVWPRIKQLAPTYE